MNNQQQSALFHERIEDALDEVIRNIGGRKAVAAIFWPDKAQRDQHNSIDHCLDPKRREKFSPTQVLFIAKKGREAGCHALINYINSECGYAPAQPIEPEDELAALQRNFIESVKAQSRMADRIETLLGSKPHLKSAA